MKILKFDNEEAWLEGRMGKITGTKAGNLVLKSGKGKKMGYYEILAERVAIPANSENVMDRGHRLEVEAVERFEEETGEKVNKDLVMMVREDDENIAYSPDGFIGKNKDVEVKCLSSARHIEAYLTQKIPSEYMEQILQGFVVNDDLETRYMVFYDPRMPISFFYLTINRSDYIEEIAYLFETEKNIQVELAEDEKKLTFA